MGEYTNRLTVQAETEDQEAEVNALYSVQHFSDQNFTLPGNGAG